jgi:uncharacterized protein (TIGR03437 family)
VRAAAVLAVAGAAPALFVTGASSGQAVALNQDGSANSPENPAARGSVVVLYGTGEGKTNSAGNPELPVALTIGGTAAEILYAGQAPGFPGLFQINARVPGAFTPRGILPVLLIVGTSASQSGVTIAVK